MILRVNGLYGWTRSNDRRSTALFGGLVVALNATALIDLTLPLLVIDPGHAPLLAWDGYAARYVPLVTLAAAVAFGASMLLHVGSVQRALGFAYVDDADEPRLCALVEPLAIAMGLPTPFVGVIESPALNAFACGLGRRDAVVVVTRGLIDGLDDDQLGAVLAHELAHVAAGDIRLLAAAGAVLRVIGWLGRTRLRRSGRWSELIMFPSMIWVMPPCFVYALLVGFCGQSVHRGGRLVRLLIAASREFVADARAVEVTQNPAALASALQCIAGRSHLGGLAPGQEAMMIAGASEGPHATHPAIGRRVDAIVATTGSMALIAPARRDTRPQAAPAAAGSRIRASVFGTARPAQTPGCAADRQGDDDGRNWLGLTPAMTLGAALAVAVFLGLHRQDLAHPAALAASLDPRPVGTVFAALGRVAACGDGLPAPLAAGMVKWGDCGDAAARDVQVGHHRVNVPMATLLKAVGWTPSDPSVGLDGRAIVETPEEEAEEDLSRRCFRTGLYRSGDRGLHGIDDPPRPDGALNIRLWLTRSERLAAAADAGGSDQALRDYVVVRKDYYEAFHRFFGEPGLAFARSAYASPVHQGAIRRLRDRLGDPRWAARLPPVERAEATLLAAAPDDFVSCVARDGIAGRRG